MPDVVNQIRYAMSLRDPQKEALTYFDAISSHCDYKKDARVCCRSCRYRILRKAKDNQS